MMRETACVIKGGRGTAAEDEDVGGLDLRRWLGSRHALAPCAMVYADNVWAKN